MSDLKTLLESVEADRLMEHVRRITRFTRLPGSEDEKAAFAYIESELVAFGLNPQRYELPAYVSLPVRAELTVAGEAFACTTHSMLPGAKVDAGVVFIPDTGKIAGRDVAGKILLTDGLAMVPVLQAAATAGAAAVVFVAGARHYHEMIVSSVWGSPEPQDLDKYMTIPAVTVTYAAGERIKEKLRNRETGARLRTQVDTHWTHLPVVAADIGDLSRGFLLLTGHVDSWHKGAMDNASGNAAVLEIARLLAPLAPSLRRGVRVVFWSGHSHGRYAGSAAYCDEFFQDLHDNAFLHVNADCLGGVGATLLTQAACMPETNALGSFAVRMVTGGELEGTRFSRSCDQSFWGTGTPSLFSSVSEQPKPESEDAASKAFGLMFGGTKSGGYGWWWHTEADTIERIDPAFLRRDTRIFLAAVYKACTEPVIPLDIRAAFADFAAVVRDYAKNAAPSIDFSPLLRDVGRVEELLADLDLRKNEEAANGFVIKFEQKLIPLVHVKGKIYGHDPALRQAPLPLLEEVGELIREKDPHRRNALGVMLKRRVNEVRNRVREIAELVQDFRATETRLG